MDEFEIDEDLGGSLPADYNVAPTDPVYAVLQRPVRDADEPTVGPRQLRVLNWGLVPFWAKDPSVGSRMINARLETVSEKPAFRRAFEKRRCLLPADGYYEWYTSTELGKGGKPIKQPFFIRPRDGGVLAMAGLYEIWRDPTRADDDPERFRWTTTIITTTAEDELGRIHDRMPLMLPSSAYDDWLDPTNDRKADLLGLLQPALPGRLEAYPVPRLVSSVANNGPELIEPLPLEDLPAGIDA